LPPDPIYLWYRPNQGNNFKYLGYSFHVIYHGLTTLPNFAVKQAGSLEFSIGNIMPTLTHKLF